MNNLYSQFLAEYCGCYVDETGNRSCDNGCLCDKCMSKSAQSAWEKFKEARN